MDRLKMEKPYVQMGWFGGKTHYFRNPPQITDWFTLPETNISLWKNNGWKTTFLFLKASFQGAYLSWRDCINGCFWFP